MAWVGLPQLQHGTLILAVALGVLVATYAVTWYVALFHSDVKRRAEAKRLLGGHLLHRGSLRVMRTGGEGDDGHDEDNRDEA